ncbi:MAG: hypothetical protein GYA21_08420 [Myxococcales bacterium]|nr:hypothetical protein [Myxococcales bacterium]
MYPRVAVEKAAREYRALAKIRVESTPEHHSIRFSRIVAEDPAELLDDFANFVLIVTVSES